VTVTRSSLPVGLPLQSDFQRFPVVALIHSVWLEVLLPSP
jgi:hypothetical protein